MGQDLDLSLAGIIRTLGKGSITVEELIDHLCDRLEEREPVIQAFLPEEGRRKRLQRDVRELKQRFPDPDGRPILFGIPIGVKDLYRVNGFPTRAGSKLPASVFAAKEAAVVTELKNAGALILGKTVTTEFAYFNPGPTRNPLNTAQTPGGSSSGSAAAVAAGYCPLSLGTQTIGSVIRPAAFCGVIGFKPSQGRMSIDGIVPFSPSIDQAGFFVNDIDSLMIAASSLVKNWKKPSELDPEQITLAIPEGAYLAQADHDIIAAFRQDIADLMEKGVRIKTISIWEDINRINNLHNDLIAREFSKVHRDWFDRYGDLYSPRSVELITSGKLVSDDIAGVAMLFQEEIRNKIEDSMRMEQIDAFVSPSTSTFAPEGLASTGSPVMNLPWTFAGVPAISIPGAVSNRGLVSALQLTASLNEDEKLVKLVSLIYDSEV